MNSSTPRFKPIKTVFQRSVDHSNDVTLVLTHGRKGYIVREKHVSGISFENDETIATLEAAIVEFDRQAVLLSILSAEAGFPLEYVQKKTGKMIPCDGEAHSNPHIDHCMVCMPRWGEVEELAPIDFEAAKKARLDIPCPMLSGEEFDLMRGKLATGEVEQVGVTRRNAFYFVYRWTGK